MNIVLGVGSLNVNGPLAIFLAPIFLVWNLFHPTPQQNEDDLLNGPLLDDNKICDLEDDLALSDSDDDSSSSSSSSSSGSSSSDSSSNEYIGKKEPTTNAPNSLARLLEIIEKEVIQTKTVETIQSNIVEQN